MAENALAVALPREAAKRTKIAEECVHDAEHAVRVISEWPEVWLPGRVLRQRAGLVRAIKDLTVKIDIRGRARAFARHVATVGDCSADGGPPPLTHEFWQKARELNDAFVEAVESLDAQHSRAVAYVENAVVAVRANADEIEGRFVGWQARSESMCREVTRWPIDWLSYTQRLDQGNLIATSQQIDDRLAAVLRGIKTIRKMPPADEMLAYVGGARPDTWNAMYELLQTLDLHVEVAEGTLRDLERLGGAFLENVRQNVLSTDQPFSSKVCVSHWVHTIHQLCSIRLMHKSRKRRREIKVEVLDDLIFNAQVGLILQKELAARCKAEGGTPNIVPAKILGKALVEVVRYRGAAFPQVPQQSRDEARVTCFADKHLFVHEGSIARISNGVTLGDIKDVQTRLAELPMLPCEG